MKDITRVILGGLVILTALTSCKETEVYDAAAKKAELSANFTKTFGAVDSEQTWNTVQNITATVTIGYEGTFTVNFYSANPFESEDAVEYGTFTVSGGETTECTFNAPDISKVYAVIYDEVNMGITRSATVTNKACTISVGATTSNAKTRTASEGGWEYSAPATFTEDVVSSIVSALPEGKNAADKKNNYEMKSTGEFTIYPVYGVTSANDAVGYYYYNPSDSANTYTEVTLIEDIKNMGSHSVITKNESWGTTVVNYNYGQAFNAWNEGTGVTLTVIGYSINVPVGWNLGFWIKNPNNTSLWDTRDSKNTTDYTTLYSNCAKNPHNEYYSAVAVDVDGYTFFGLEDWANNAEISDMDCNDIVFAMTGSTPSVPEVIVPGEEEESVTQTVTFAFEDLGSTDDFDFNDVVLYVQYVTGGSQAEVKVMCAGGTLPVSLYYGSNLVWKKENSATMVNTTSWEGVIKTVTFDIDEGFDLTSTETLEKFSISVQQTADETDLSSSTIVSAASVKGSTPQALVIAGAWAWPTERTNISKAYPNFATWVGNATETSWSEDMQEAYVITPTDY